MGLFEHFPYTNFHNLNLDWLINEIKNLGNQAVLSVNGMTGDVVLYKSENIVFPEVEADTWRMVRIADGHTACVMFQNGLMYVMFDNAAERVYTVDHPPTFPVTSVNGQTGAVELYQDAGVRLPDVTEEYTNIRRQIQTNGVDNIVGIEVKADKAYRMKDTQRAEIYDAMNQPPYPVTSVNGQTGAVMLAIPFSNVHMDDVMFSQAATGHSWSIGRETPDGVASIQIRTDASKAEAWIDFFTDTTPQVTYTKKLLTTDDIPSGSGVVSINGLSGVVISVDVAPLPDRHVQHQRAPRDHRVPEAVPARGVGGRKKCAGLDEKTGDLFRLDGVGAPVGVAQREHPRSRNAAPQDLRLDQDVGIRPFFKKVPHHEGVPDP